jgi:hypothetical protein
MNADEKQEELNRQDAKGAKSGDRCWWIKMLVASAALATVLLGAYFLTPVAQLHYHAWRFRSGRDPWGDHLRQVVSVMVRRKECEPVVVRLLGAPSQKKVGAIVYRTFGEIPDDVMDWTLTIRDGRVVAFDEQHAF